MNAVQRARLESRLSETAVEALNIRHVGNFPSFSTKGPRYNGRWEPWEIAYILMFDYDTCVHELHRTHCAVRALYSGAGSYDQKGVCAKSFYTRLSEVVELIGWHNVRPRGVWYIQKYWEEYIRP